VSENSNIAWCDHTFNSWIGCTKVSPGCDHCYAERERASTALRVVWGAGNPRHRTAESTWNNPKRWNARHAEFFAKHGRRQRVFCASLADVFDNAVDPAWRRDLFELIACTPNLDWLLLTKRIGNARMMLNDVVDELSHGLNTWDEMPWGNVWVGATIVNQPEADRDIWKLLVVPARVHFLSIEPQLGLIDLESVAWPNTDGHRVDVLRGGYWNQAPYMAGARSAALGAPKGGFTNHFDMPATVDAVFVGGESGPRARPTHPMWIRALRDQCAGADVPLLFKQWGQWRPGSDATNEQLDAARADGWVSLDGAFHDGKDERAFRPGDERVISIGKKLAGRTLDGAIHHAFPGERSTTGPAERQSGRPVPQSRIVSHDGGQHA